MYKSATQEVMLGKIKAGIKKNLAENRSKVEILNYRSSLNILKPGLPRLQERDKRVKFKNQIP